MRSRATTDRTGLLPVRSLSRLNECRRSAVVWSAKMPTEMKQNDRNPICNVVANQPRAQSVNVNRLACARLLYWWMACCWFAVVVVDQSEVKTRRCGGREQYQSGVPNMHDDDRAWLNGDINWEAMWQAIRKMRESFGFIGINRYGMVKCCFALYVWLTQLFGWKMV